MIGQVRQNSSELSQPPEIESNWLRLIVYLVIFIICVFVLFIPVVIIFSDEFTSGNKSALEQNQFYTLLSQFVFALAVCIATYFLIVKVEYRKIVTYRLTLEAKPFLFGFALGMVCLILFSVLVSLLGLVEFNFYNNYQQLGLSFAIYSFVAISEEALVRGYILTNLQEKLNPFWALVISSLFFGALHIGNDYFTWVGFITISLSGFFMGLLVLKTNSISSAIGMHWSWNFIQGPILGFAVSGHQETGLFKITSKASDLLSGGKFGAEGSVILTSITFMLIYIIYKYYTSFEKRSNYGE